jgi:HEAT repeat protein
MVIVSSPATALQDGGTSEHSTSRYGNATIPDEEVRGAVVQSLASTGRRIGITAVLDYVAAALYDCSALVRLNAVIALGELRNPRAVQHLKVALHDPNSDVSGFAAVQLEKFR